MREQLVTFVNDNYFRYGVIALDVVLLDNNRRCTTVSRAMSSLSRHEYWHCKYLKPPSKRNYLWQTLQHNVVSVLHSLAAPKDRGAKITDALHSLNYCYQSRGNENGIFFMPRAFHAAEEKFKGSEGE